MAQVALGAVGAVVGLYVCGPVGASLGWSIGAAAGGVLFPPKGPHTEGPRLTDLKQQLSTYGAPKTLVYGRVGLTGCVMWTSDIIEIVSTTEEGKGEPSSSSTTYSYFWSGAVLIAKGPRIEDGGVGYHSLLRIWVNGKVFYDVRDTTNVEAMIASTNFAQYFTWYPGTYTQMPDPTMEAALGVGNVPAYRGRSYIVFHDLPLELFNNYPPGALNFMFELQRTGPTATGIQLLAEGLMPGALYMYPVVGGVVRIGTPGNSTETAIYTSNADLIGIEEQTEEESRYPEMYPYGPGDSTLGTALLYDGTTVRATNQNLGPFSDPTHLLYAELEGSGGPQVDIKLIFPDQTQWLNDVIPCADRRHLLVLTGAPGLVGVSDTWWLLVWNGDTSAFEIEDTGTVAPAGPGPGGSPGEYLASSASQGSGLWSCAMLESNLRWMWVFDGITGPVVAVHYIDDDGVLDEWDEYVKSPPEVSFGYTLLWADNGIAWTVSGGFYNMFTREASPGDNAEVLSDVVSDISLRASLTAGQIDVTELTDIVDGFRIVPVGAGRAFLNHLERTYWFDSVETGGQIKFVKRGQASVVTIPQDDLGAYAADSGAFEDVVINDRSDEDSLPGEIAVGYLTKDADYQVGVQLAQREATVSEQPSTVELPVVLSDLKAKEVGEVLLYDAWLGRTRRSFKTSRKYSYLEPTDVVTLELDEATYVVRIISMKINGGILEFVAVDEDDAIYDPNSAAGAIIDPNPGVVLSGPTFLALMDLPALRSVDSDAGFYVAACGYYEDWAGFQLFVSIDGGATYTAQTASSTEATMGTVPAALGDYTGGNFFDSENEITVNLRHGTLTSVTDAQIYAGANAFALGNETVGFEVIQFKTAELVSGSTYILRQLLRGRKGTEHQQSTHVVNEKFVLLTSATVLRVPMEVASLNVARLYKGVTFFQPVVEATAISFTNTGAALKPYSPVHARILRDPADDMVIYWIRRGRLNNEWVDGIDVPLSEASESYSIEIYSGATLKRTLTSATQSVAYTAAQETTDFGSPQSSISLRIYQISADVGRGFGFIGSVSVIG
jgi:hypothetical protein